MSLSNEEIKQIALLARIKLSELEVQQLSDQLSEILDNFKILEEIDTSEVEPTAQTFELENVDRLDETSIPIDRELTLESAPRSQEGYFRVRRVLE
ncbi:MAG: Asp-tRNA(Asn)/Glu-tRNA(Gln) amidotransferase subunit GatC [Dehalococcoidia bacterium]